MSQLDWRKFIVDIGSDIRSAIQQMNALGKGMVLVCQDGDVLLGVVTDGDLRRGILAGLSLEENVGRLMNPNFRRLELGYTASALREAFATHFIRYVPVLEGGRLRGLLARDQMEALVRELPHRRLGLPVVVMAGGLGTRMQPFTLVLPKPLIPIGDKTMLELILEEYQKYDCQRFFLSVNYKAQLIKAYLDDSAYRDKVEYLREEKPLGTAGGLKMLQGRLDTSFFVSNCDIIIREDYAQILDFHRAGGYRLTLVAAMQHHTVPYGVCEIENGGDLALLREKPQYDFLVNTGMYLLEPSVLELIPEGEFFNITDLIERIRQMGQKVGVFPVAQSAYVDVGQWEVYKKAIELLSF